MYSLRTCFGVGLLGFGRRDPDAVLPDPLSVSTQRSLPALRQLTPDSAAFIQQSQQQPPPASQPSTALTAVVLSGSVQRTAGKTAATVTSSLQPPVISLTQPTQVGVGKQGQPTPLVCRREPLLPLPVCPTVSSGGACQGLAVYQPLQPRWPAAVISQRNRVSVHCWPGCCFRVFVV